MSSPSPRAGEAGEAGDPEVIRVAIADDHPLWVRALEALLEGAPDLEVVTTCATAEEVLARCGDGVDLLLLDYQMPPGDALEVLGQLSALDAAPHVVVLSAFTEEGMVRTAVDAGARGYLSKTETLDDLPALLARVADGEMVLSEEAQAALAASSAPDRPELSAREQQVLDLAAAGLTDEAIARRLGVSRHTIRTYLTRIFGKLGAANRAEAVALFAQQKRSPSGGGQ